VRWCYYLSVKLKTTKKELTMSNIETSEIIAQAVMIVEDYERVKKENDKLKELFEDTKEEIRDINKDLKEVLDQNKALRRRVKDLDAENFILSSHKELNARSTKRTEHYTKLMTAKDREIDTLRDEVAYLESKIDQMMSDRFEVTHHYITEDEWRF
jgi:predicted RNase H-like nuclease (RuvC/YqgF family)